MRSCAPLKISIPEKCFMCKIVGPRDLNSSKGDLLPLGWSDQQVDEWNGGEGKSFLKVLDQDLFLQMTPPLPDRRADHATGEDSGCEGDFPREAKLHRSHSIRHGAS